MLLGLGAYTWDSAICVAQEAGADDKGAQVLTRGPVHEAFAGIVTFNPVPGVIVTKAPPVPIEEVPPGERPVGTNITWIPGYWAWDDERTDFLWVSGTWRALPPGRQWMAGYWSNIDKGYQWTSGYWADAAVAETTYLPAPPATVEDGPNTEAPSRDYGWTPGSWMWQQERYAWSPGYWAQGRANWDWTPSHYVWTPRGYVYVGGFWDYSMERRGMLYAPVYFDSGVYGRSGYNYTPNIALDLGLLAANLFLRPSYHHYYFGDYYAPSYDQSGYYAAAAFQSNRNGYDPIYSQQRWQHRQDQGWSQRSLANYQNLRNNDNARPPRTWAATSALAASTAGIQQNRSMLLAAPADQLAKRNGGAMKLQAVGKADRQMLAQRGQQVQQLRDQRRTLETQGATAAGQQAGGALKPTNVKLPRSPIVAKSASQMPKSQAPPKMQRAPQADLTGRTPQGGQQSQVQPNGTPQGADRRAQPDGTPQGANRKAQPDGTPQGANRRAQPAPAQRGQQPQVQPNGTPQGADRKAQPDGTPQGANRKAQPEPAQRGQQPQVQPNGTSQGANRKAQPEPAQRGQQPQVQPNGTSQGADRKAQPDGTPQGTNRKAQPDGATQGANRRAQPAPAQRTKDAPNNQQVQPERTPRGGQQPQAQQRSAPQPQQRAAPQPQQREAPQPQQRAAPQPQQRAAPQPQQRAAPQPQQRAAPQPQQREAPQPQQRAAPQPQAPAQGTDPADKKDKKSGRGGN